MSLRLARLFTATLIGLSASATVLAAGPQLVWRGDITTARGVVTDVAKAWEKAGKGKIELQPFNTASGIDAVAKGSADLAGSARPGIGAAEQSLTFTPVAWDALVMVTYPSNPVSNITLKQLHEIYMGRITNWKDLGGEDAPINLYAVASPQDGVEYSLRRLLFGRGNQPVAAPRLYVNVAKLEEGVTLDKRGLGASTLAGASSNKKVKILSIDGVAPSMSTVGSGAYPLYTELYLVTNETGPKAAEVKDFIAFVTSSAGSSLLRSHNLVPYADGASLASKDAARRASIASTVGTRANVGQPMTTPTAAPAAAPALAAAAVAKETAVAKAQVAGKGAKAAKETKASVATTAEPSQFAKVVASVTTSAHQGFKGVHAEAFTSSDNAKVGGKFAKVLADAVTVKGKPVAKPAAPVDATEKSSAVATPKVADAAPVAKPAKVAKAEAKKPAAAARTYKVAQGDTLYSIAKKNAVDVNQLRAMNGLKDNNVRLGQVLKVGAR
ncbi:phosphate transport system substrate-binding protein [Luteibacter sp. UNCMF331Sha3.1]|uniref:LysM peptidoglycan-binding domain-containing protein n=1 Tax=Luteibacter sp. UNCMF331Sha3.1 TaxID=1502760 RepID=UPI0008D1DB54|nr:substrate-binding domain-containing protein [Luteibacter sp. UNCMF331Sha3.1]SEM79337.1 phosphate transport system substrate-binding protein [Luteibacter sp. UNCMF331Sha3.1]